MNLKPIHAFLGGVALTALIAAAKFAGGTPRNAKRIVKLFRSLGYGDEKLRLVVNKYQPDELLDVPTIEQAVGLKVHRTIPNQIQAVTEAFNLGKPLELLHPQNGVLKALREMTSVLLHAPLPKPRGWIDRLIGKAA